MILLFELWLTLVLIATLVVFWLLIGAVLRGDSYPPEAAEAPPRDDIMALAKALDYNAMALTVAFDETLEARLLAELYDAVDAYRRGEDIEADAPKERI